MATESRNLLIGILIVLFFFSSASARGGGGCFLSETPILTADGNWRNIDDIAIGDRLAAFTPDGKLVNTTVKEIFTTTADEYYVINNRLKVTAEHPFYAGGGRYKTAAELNEGDTVYLLYAGGLTAETVKTKKLVHENMIVFNLQTDWPNTFFAEGYAVHNKGCFLAGTKVAVLGGEKSIEDITSGDKVLSFDDSGRIRIETVEATYELTEPCYYEISAGEHQVNATGAHPFLTEDGFMAAEELTVGERVYILGPGGLHEEEITKKKLTCRNTKVYNLHVNWPNTFFAGGFAVHNKGGGCFTAGTRVMTLRCEKNIESVAAGDEIVSATRRGVLRSSYVVGTYRTTAEILSITTGCCIVNTTAEHPFMTAGGVFRKAGELSIGDSIMVYDRGSLTEERIVSIESLGESTVYNLDVSWPSTFIANKFIVHNKGGGGGFGGGFSGGGGAGSGGGNDWCNLICIIFFILLFSLARGQSKEDEDLDYLFPEDKVNKKAERTKKVLDYLKGIDPIWDTALLEKTAQTTFLKLQDCWQKRDYSEMKPLMMPDIFNQHVQQLESMKRNHEINMIADLTVENLRIVNLRHYLQKNMQEYTALIQATARDYFVDDRDHKFLRGDSSPAHFQEFWVFQRQNDSWLLKRIDQSRESNSLRAETFVEELTPYQLKSIYGSLAKPTAVEAAPWLDEKVDTQSVKIHRLLNFLSKTDRSWNEENMKTTASKAFVEVLTAYERLDTSAISELVSLKMLAECNTAIDTMKATNTTVEYRNLCVRKADIVLVKNYNNDDRDRFTARISAHAQIIRKQSNSIIEQDDYVSPFMQYVTFQRTKGEWKLSAIDEPAKEAYFLTQENVDETTPEEQLKWYYTKDRAL